MKQLLLVLLLLLALVPTPTKAVAASAEPCTVTLAKADADEDQKLTSEEFSSFCYHEAHKTPAAASLLKDSQLWPTLVDELFDVLKSSQGDYVDIAGASSGSSASPQQASFLNLICQRSKMAIVKILQESLQQKQEGETDTGTGEVISRGPFVGEAKVAGAGGLTGAELAGVQQVETEDGLEVEGTQSQPPQEQPQEQQQQQPSEVSDPLPTDTAGPEAQSGMNANGGNPNNGELRDLDMVVLISNTELLTIPEIAGLYQPDLLTAFGQFATAIFDQAPQDDEDNDAMGEPTDGEDNDAMDEPTDTMVERPQEGGGDGGGGDQPPVPLPLPTDTTMVDQPQPQQPSLEGGATDAEESGSDTTVQRPPTRTRLLQDLEPQVEPTMTNASPTISSLENTDCPEDVQGGEEATCHLITVSFPGVPRNEYRFFVDTAESAVEDGGLQSLFDTLLLPFAVESLYSVGEASDGEDEQEESGYYDNAQLDGEGEENVRVQLLHIDTSFQVAYTAYSAFHDISAAQQTRTQFGRSLVLSLEKALDGIIQNCVEKPRPGVSNGTNTTDIQSETTDIRPERNMTDSDDQEDRPDIPIRPDGSNMTGNMTNIEGPPPLPLEGPPTRRSLAGERSLRVALNTRQRLDLGIASCSGENRRFLQNATGSQGVGLCFSVQFEFEIQLIGDDEDGEATYEQVQAALADPSALEQSLSEFSEDNLQYTIEGLSFNDYRVEASSESPYIICPQVVTPPPPPRKKGVIINSSILIASPGGLTAAQLAGNQRSRQALSEAYRRFVQRVDQGVRRRGIGPGGRPNQGDTTGESSLGTNMTGQVQGGNSDEQPMQPASGVANMTSEGPDMGEEEGVAAAVQRPGSSQGQPEGGGPTEGGEMQPPGPEEGGEMQPPAQSAGETPPSGGRRRLLRHGSVWDRTRALVGHLRRFLVAELDENSMEIYAFEDTPCGNEDSVAVVSRQAQNCITIFGKFRVTLDEEDDEEEIYQIYSETANLYIANGTFDEVWMEVDPGTNFTVIGVSDEVDEDFNAFEEFAVEDDGMSSESDTVTFGPATNPPTNAPFSTPSPTNATAPPSDESSSATSVAALQYGTLLSLSLALLFT